MIIRELVAMFGIGTDPKGFQQADKKVSDLGSRMSSTLASLGIAFGVGAAFHFARDMVEMASTVGETMNVVNTSFGDNADRVVEWAESSGEAMGRARSQMLSFSAGLGAMIQPMIGSRDEAANMSTTLSELAVDLGSFFNVADEDALQAIKAGLIGSTEPMMKFGVVMNDVALKAYALEQGIKKKYEKMTQAEKVGLRYRFMLEKTADAQGDAVKTASGYANRVKALNAGVQNLKETLGNKLLPVATKIVGWAIDAAKAFGDMATKTRGLEAAFYVAAAALLPFAINAAIAAAPVLILAAGFAAITAIVTEFLKLLAGEENTIDDFFNELYGKKRWQEIKDEWSAGFKALKLMITDFGAFLRGDDPALVNKKRGGFFNLGPKGLNGPVDPMSSWSWDPTPLTHIFGGAPLGADGKQLDYSDYLRQFWGKSDALEALGQTVFPFATSPGAGGAGVVVHEGDTIITVQGSATPETAREIGRQVNGANRQALETTRKAPTP